MEKTKFESEMKSLIKVGLPESMAYLIASHKHCKNKDEVDFAINEIKEQQEEIADSIKDFKPLSEKLNLNNNNNNDKN
jgi:hypothetical protein